MASPNPLRRFFSDNSMSIALFSLFVVCIACQSVVGWVSDNQSLSDGGFRSIGYGDFLRTGEFLDGVFSNWQAAILQLAVLIAFSSVMRQRGAAHSKKTPEEAHAQDRRTVEWKFRPRSTAAEWLYANSLSIVFFSCFVVAFVLHWVFGHMRYDEDQALRHLPPVSLASYFVAPDFWESVFQTWEAEFFAIGFYIVLSIFLRQEGSAESKRVGARNQDTGELNE